MATLKVNSDFSLSADYDDVAQSPSGINAHFMTIGHTGFKLYQSEKLRDRSYNNQFNLNQLGLAPSVGNKTIVTVKHLGTVFTFYAFETEIVDCFDRKHYGKLQSAGDFQAARDYREKYEFAAREVQAMLPEYITWIDDHAGNAGYTDDGRPVILDCADDLYGDGSVEDF